MGQRSVAGRRVGRLGCAVGRAAGAMVEGLEARCLLSAVLFVDESAVGSGDGSSWANAFTDLQAALSQAAYGDEIHIAAGTYKPTATTDRTISFELKDGVSLLGGYAGYGAGNPDARDITVYHTILSGDIGVNGDNTDNSYHVIVSNNISSAAVLDGVATKAGHADGGSDNYGGGMYNRESSPTLTNCTFSENMARYGGGGMYNSSSSAPTLVNCTFSENAASGSDFTDGSGGGMCNYSSSPTLTNCTFIGNQASGSGDFGGGLGGGMSNDYHSSPTLTICTFIGNMASGGRHSAHGGGMYNRDSSPTLTNCTFSGNTARGSSTGSGYGGGMYNVFYSSPTLTNCAFSGNTVSGYGGGMYNDSWMSSPKLTNCTFSENTASGVGDSGGFGGGMYNSFSSPTLADCEFDGNTANGSSINSGYGGGMYNYDSSASLTDCTFSGNIASSSDRNGGYGGGMYNTGSSPILAICTFSDNSASGTGDASGYGGGMYNATSSPTLTDSTFSGNTASGIGESNGYGGGMYNEDDSSPTLVTCTFSGNTASSLGDSGRYDRSGCGGGMYNAGSSATLTNCTFSGNTASGIGIFHGFGGGMYNSFSPLTLTDCSFIGNQASGGGSNGGGMHNYSSSPTLTNCSFNGNTASSSESGGGNGGGMYNYWYSSPTLTNCIFSGNTASGVSDASYGGGMYNSNSSPTLTDCTFSGNTASGSGDLSGYGGGMYNSSSSDPVLINCAFSGNVASSSDSDGGNDGRGGGMYNSDSSPTLTGCTFSGNTASGVGDFSGYGGAMYNVFSSSPTLTNCTFSGNTARGSGIYSGLGGGMYNGSSSPTLTNCIVWDNGGTPIDKDSASKPVITYSDIQGGYTGSHNINADPLFVRNPSLGPDGVWGTADDDYGDLRLQVGSPCINAGNNEASGIAEITTDMGGNPRIINDTLDLGAYEGEVIDPIFGAKHPLKFSDTDNDTVTIGISGGGGGTLSPGNAIALTGTNSKSVLTIAVKKGVGGDGLFHISGITSEGPLKGINASAVVVSGRVLINTLNQDAGTTSVSLKFRTISEADVQIQGMPVASIAVSDAVSDSRIVTTGSIGKFSAAALLNSDILIGVATGFAGQFAGHGDFANPVAKLGSLKVTGQKLPKGQLAPAFVVNSDISAPSVETVSLVNVAATSDPIVHVMTDAGVLKVSQTKLVDEEMFGNGTWKKAGVRPGIWQVV